MPIISRHACNRCDFEMPAGWGGYTYAVDDAGERVVCRHPGEFRVIHEVTGLGYTEANAAGRAGYAEHCVCLDCLKQFDLDRKRDPTACATCGSDRVKSLRQLLGRRCPKCKAGVFEECPPIPWKLDPDWEQLPVPQIVKDLLHFLDEREVRPSLQRAAEVANEIGSFTLVTLAIRLLNWWQGSFVSPDKPPRNSMEMNPQWTWCRVLPAVLAVTPSLAELIEVRDGHCWLSASIEPQVWRGIKNYIRKHRRRDELRS